MASKSSPVAAFAIAIAYALQILLLLLAATPCSAQQQTPAVTTNAISDDHVALYVFGDSLYDTGMGAIKNPKSLVKDQPYGETFFKQPTGRYSDGRTVPDFIAEYAKLPYPPPYLKSGLTNYTNGVSYAVAGSCVLVDVRPGTINLKNQVDYFSQMVEKMRKELGDEDTKKVVSKAVYLFSAGGNDYATLITSILNNSLNRTFRDHFMSMVIGNLTSHIRTLYNKGGRKFAFQSVGPFGCFPSTKKVWSDAGKNPGTCVKEWDAIIKDHNAHFLTSIKKLGSQLSGFKYSVFDYYAATIYRVAYYTKYGFKESKTACCGSGTYNGGLTCGSTAQKFNLCSTPSDYLWFDAAHPTDKANGQFAELFWSGSSNDVASYNLKSLFET